MGIVAGRAHSVLDGRVNVFHLPEQRMALAAQLGDTFRELEGLFLLLGMWGQERVVAGIARLCRGMNIFGIQQVLVTFCSSAALFLRDNA